jgi:hypothetical protein
MKKGLKVKRLKLYSGLRAIQWRDDEQPILIQRRSRAILLTKKEAILLSAWLRRATKQLTRRTHAR